MNSTRRSPITRATAWILTAAMVLPALYRGQSAKAQANQTLRVIIADTVNKTPGVSATLGIQTTAAIGNELTNTGLGRYSVATPTEVRQEAIALGIRVPSSPTQPANFSQEDLIRIAKGLPADAIITSEVGASPIGKGKPVQVNLILRVIDASAEASINGGTSSTIASVRPGEAADLEELLNRAVQDSSADVVRQVVQRDVGVTSVLNISGNTAVLQGGVSNGIHQGDDVVIVREGAAGVKVRVGRVHVVRVYNTDSEADIIDNQGGIRADDIGRVIYRAPIDIPFVPLTARGGQPGINPKPNGRAANFTAAAVGGTLGVILLGVLATQAAHGGQQSVTSITAEPTSEGPNAAVRVRWADNIFGQGNVQQYKIFREPDFPFGVVGSNNNNNTTLTGGSVPVGFKSGIEHEYIDRPSPQLPYRNGAVILVGASNGGILSQGAGGGNNNGNTNTTTTLAPSPLLDTGFTPGKTYNYLVDAVIARNIPTAGGTTGTGGNGGGGGGGNNNTNGNTEYIETDPGRTGITTPVTPVPLSAPANATGNVNSQKFAPVFASTAGADILQLEISTDRTFKNRALIYTQQIISTAPNVNGVIQSVQPIDLTQLPQLLADPTFAAFVAQSAGTTPAPPRIYYRVGARHDEDLLTGPGPVHWITQDASDPDKTFRFVYDQPFFFTPAPLPPPPPGTGATPPPTAPSRAARALNSKYSNKQRATVNALLPGDTALGGHASIQNHVLTPQEILSGRGRKRN